jgi:hypothetical protein
MIKLINSVDKFLYINFSPCGTDAITVSKETHVYRHAVYPDKNLEMTQDVWT